jgi:ABC-type branched-subunit amino acid transport system ATPase component
LTKLIVWSEVFSARLEVAAAFSNGGRGTQVVDREIVLKVSDLCAGYQGHVVVHNASMHAAAGEVVGLAGRNGSGKSTILLGISGLTWTSCGEVELGSKSVSRMPAHLRAKMGLAMLLQKDAIFPDLSVRLNLLLAGTEASDAQPFVSDSPAATVVESVLNRQRTPAGALSGGERRLLGLVLVLAQKPCVLLADEPTLGLSSDVEVSVVSYLQQYAASNGRAVILVSHNLSMLAKTCDRTYVISGGRISGQYLSAQSEVSLEQMLG